MRRVADALIVPHEVHREPHGIYIRLMGPISGKRLGKFCVALKNGSDWGAVRYVIADLSGVHTIEVSRAELLAVRSVLSPIAESYPDIMLASVDVGKEARRFIGRALIHKVWPGRFESFLSIELARKWIRSNRSGAL